MKAALLAVFAMTAVGFFMFLEWETHDRRKADSDAQTVAVNFMLYRNAAFIAAINKKQNGQILFSELSEHLPSGFPHNHPWKAQVEGAFLYVWGQASDKDIEAARDAARGSAAVGKVENGALAPQKHNAVPLPGFVASGSLASVLGLGFDTETP